ncbi:PGF-CTERM sorting domain-containing protein [Natrinema sp. 1APR25-10V2]|uniref:PGF-CTERM sorting domain-containing protein n=1 Tax=Natrinema sp. 1APR25-10V2 TaxID=2951081 RepID=UPI0028761FA1|nr:PGF-CTERM sorting domain-containing protein [Natrinema sp. 1APR25-10V2]MDS0475335.1 PGF-CTERM sorting domain-containing protein [Natrinema sp. 1APR25-10V2]
MNRGAALLVALLVATSTVTMAAAGAAATTADGSSTTIETDAEVDGGTSLEADADASTETDATLTAQSSSDAGADSSAYAGANVAFDVQGDAITDYRVGGERTFASVAVQSQSEADSSSSGGLDGSLGLEAATNLNGAGLSVASQTQASAQITADSGATLSAHDTQRGTLVVESGGEAQYVEADLAAEAQASETENRVLVETGDRKGVFLVVGNGEVGVTDGNVTADLGANATLTFRSYAEGERDEGAKYEESLIAEGNAAVEVTAEQRSGELVTDAVTYGQETSANVSQTAKNRVDVTIDRAVHEGTVVMTTVSEEAVGSFENLSVRIDGEAAVKASSRSELESAIGSDQSRYMVVQDAQAEGQATVYIAVNHFSTRTATIDGGNGGSDDGTSGDDGGSGDGSTGSSGDSTPGFGVGGALVALVIGTGARIRR